MSESAKGLHESPHHSDNTTTGKLESQKVSDELLRSAHIRSGFSTFGHFAFGAFPCIVSASRSHLVQHIAADTPSTRLLAPARGLDALPLLQTKSPSLPSVSLRVWQALGDALVCRMSEKLDACLAASRWAQAGDACIRVTNCQAVPYQERRGANIIPCRRQALALVRQRILSCVGGCQTAVNGT